MSTKVRRYVPPVEVEPKPLARSTGEKVMRRAVGFLEHFSKRDAKAILGAIAHEQAKVEALTIAFRAANDELLGLRMRVSPPAKTGRNHPANAHRRRKPAHDESP